MIEIQHLGQPVISVRVETLGAQRDVCRYTEDEAANPADGESPPLQQHRLETSRRGHEGTTAGGRIDASHLQRVDSSGCGAPR